MMATLFIEEKSMAPPRVRAVEARKLQLVATKVAPLADTEPPYPAALFSNVTLIRRAWLPDKKETAPPIPLEEQLRKRQLLNVTSLAVPRMHPPPLELSTTEPSVKVNPVAVNTEL
jgi:hypothetical protein